MPDDRPRSMTARFGEVVRELGAEWDEPDAEQPEMPEIGLFVGLRRPARPADRARRQHPPPPRARHHSLPSAPHRGRAHPGVRVPGQDHR
ncbi:hypothetical protein ACFCX4_28055 [Kitasatospora sp. NPDC056327]|uniref:hypothetical protein n=1 Tax=Kitasatospora sp. NPDC056327 TaxID=3345785 RepID=UPI0035DD7A61